MTPVQPRRPPTVLHRCLLSLRTTSCVPPGFGAGLWTLILRCLESCFRGSKSMTSSPIWTAFQGNKNGRSKYKPLGGFPEFSTDPIPCMVRALECNGMKTCQSQKQRNLLGLARARRSDRFPAMVKEYSLGRTETSSRCETSERDCGLIIIRQFLTKVTRRSMPIDC